VRDLKTGLTWTAPSARARLRRDSAGVAIAASARLTGQAGNWVDVGLSGVYTRDRSRILLDAGVDGFKPSMLADLSPDVALLRGVDIALSGRLHIEADGHGEVRSIAIDVTGGNGQVTLPGQPSMRSRTPPASSAPRSISARPRSRSPAPASARTSASCSPAGPRSGRSPSIDWATTGRSNLRWAAGSGR
jgi:hypothetical protein